MSDDKLFNIFSCSKPITVTAALQLYERGYFLLDDPLYEFIPEFKEMYIKLENGERAVGLVVVNQEDEITVITEFGFGKSSQIDLPSQVSGLVPTAEWKEKKYHSKYSRLMCRNGCVKTSFSILYS